MITNPSTYSEAEIAAIAGWLRDGDSASRIAVRLSELRRESVSRNAIVGIVHRNKHLAAIGFSRAGHSSGGSKPLVSKEAARRRAAHKPHCRPFAELTHAEKRAATSPAYLPAKLFVQSVGDVSPDPAIQKLYAAPPITRPRPIIKPGKYDAGSRHIPLVDLCANECRFPVNDVPPGGMHLFCGEVTGEGISYCAHHAARVFAGFSSRAA
ncbi:GcrA family cell cycle regulator [Mesorhizobium sp. M0910]|uniref:GcrA family cell cycle regulator n=1 Tax=Mesorhizobium sp. M0910 TaxID=2957025 RepID=UPI003338C307